jgi:transposase-like protein
VRQVKHGQILPIAGLRVDGGTQPRAVLDFEAIEDYAEAMSAGVKFPPVAAFYDGDSYWLADGFHRVKAAYAAGFDSVLCDVHQGTIEDAQWYSFSANRGNGLRRTTQDKQRAVKAALIHGRGTTLSDTQVARHVGVDQKTVANWRRQLEVSQEIPKIATRAVTRRGKTYQQQTTNIGKRNGTAPAARKAPHGSKLFNAILRALKVIAACEISPDELARLLASRPNRNQLISFMEKANEFLESCAIEARRTGIDCEPADHCGESESQARDDADHTATGTAVA